MFQLSGFCYKPFFSEGKDQLAEFCRSNGVGADVEKAAILELPLHFRVPGYCKGLGYRV